MEAFWINRSHNRAPGSALYAGESIYRSFSNQIEVVDWIEGLGLGSRGISLAERSEAIGSSDWSLVPMANGVA